MNKINVGIIGCGYIAHQHATAIEHIDSMCIHGVCDLDLKRAESFSERYRARLAVRDPQRIIDCGDIDAVYICTHHDTHIDLCLRAASAGKHILIEKPLALTIEECLKIGRAVEGRDIVMMPAFKLRFYDMVCKAKELIPDPILVTTQMMDDPWPASFWASDPVKGGGNVLSQGCHSCDLLRFFAGSDPVEVYAAGDNYYSENGIIDNLCATFRFANGMSGSWVQGDAGCPHLTSKFFVQLFAYGKSVTISDRLCTLSYSQTGKPAVIHHSGETGFLEENRIFARCLLEGQTVPVGFVDGLWATYMVLKSFQSIEDRAVIRLSTENLLDTE